MDSKGVTYLRMITRKSLELMTEPLELTYRDTPVAVLMPYRCYLGFQKQVLDIELMMDKILTSEDALGMIRLLRNAEKQMKSEASEVS
jgi:hypothetical protein